METCHTLITLSVYPANKVCPSDDQAKEVHSGCCPEAITSCLSSSTTILPSKSYKEKKCVEIKATVIQHLTKFSSQQ